MPNPTQTELTSNWKEHATRIANRIRLRVLEHVLTNNGGYMSQACSSAELFAALYTRILKLAPSQAPMVPAPFKGVPANDNPSYTTGGIYNGPKTAETDRFIFSPAHYALVLYTTLIEVGRMSPEGLKQFNQDGSSVEMIGAEHSPGCEVTNGSLGQSISQAIGIALGRRLKGETGRVIVMMSDGEFNEGQTWEAIASMSHYKLDNMLVYVDVNGQCVDGKLDETMNIEPLQSRLEAFGSRVFRVNAHDLDALAAPAELTPDGRPTFILSYSNPTQGLPLLQTRAPKLHYLRFKDEAERESYLAVYQTMLANMPAAL
ncbi:MAG: transketolase [Anaerolinea sp.]|nr:transketolase [Anaerolinea sp.]